MGFGKRQTVHGRSDGGRHKGLSHALAISPLSGRRHLYHQYGWPTARVQHSRPQAALKSQGRFAKQAWSRRNGRLESRPIPHCGTGKPALRSADIPVREFWGLSSPQSSTVSNCILREFPARHARPVELSSLAMTPLPQPDVIFTHESDLDGLLAGALLQRLAQKRLGTDIPLEAYHYNFWKQRELRERSAWVADFTFEPRLDKPDWVVIDHHVTETAPK